MKKIIIVFVTCIIVVFVAVLLVGNKNDNQPVTNPDGSGFPNPTGGNRPGTPLDGTIVLTTETGETLVVSDFLNQPTVEADQKNPGYYYLGNHFPADPNAVFTNPEYVIEYISDTNYFNIALLQEPLAQSRLHAEEYLMQQLGITEQEMCALRYTVSVPRTVNSYFAGDSLGFSFCPGSFPLE